MTANALRSAQRRCFQVGMNDFIPKLVDTHQLFEKLVQHIQPRDGLGEEPMNVITPEESLEKPVTLPPSLPGLYIKEAMDRLNGNESLFRSLLKEFEQLINSSSQQIAQWIEEDTSDNLEHAARSIHTLKGMAGNISANDLYQAAKQLEMAVRQRSAYHEAFRSFSKVLAQTNASIAQFNRDYPQETQPVKAASDDELNHAEIDHLINELIPLMEEQRYQGLVQAETLIEMLAGSSFNDLIEKIRTPLETLDFEDVLSILKELKTELNRRLG
ncbi:Hpt domain-containing protein [Magnetococcales bacterium HHB-1]